MKLVIAGAAGRMGRMLIATVRETPGAALAAAVDRPGSEAIGADAGVLAGVGPLGVAVGDDVAAALDGADAVIDFTAPAATVATAKLAAERGVAHVIGTTGMSGEQLDEIAEAARRTVIVRSGNMSLGVNLLAALVRQAAAALGEDFDIEVLEMHHRHKVDAPSGTALLLGEAAAQGRGIALGARSVRTRDGHTGPRRPGDIGFATLRGGSVVGDHSVIFAGPQERIILSHHAEDRGIFSRGAVRAALWTRGQKPGLYSMADVLGVG
ncbi:4-hydroxy-tetrahydrodipicolinate reductase [Camelimonas abortus]|uniref:4-hydroxy-tetrahydrodipicolinate reductase n=1 Tax=Camelimonas abortus TaxID=1017184 RepID=A0ABV7LAQ0_9HYPH